ncbi:30S ribosomal protein S18 [Candidatus Paracaedibacter symbiosus]|uniref:30S ribosomal protein S18 n=1 Tax=Candidatus Paracaedibacter symbiosus TaxID=244582 RepID=UPI000509ADCA|nr:30S ribosomal protein S18 [Candidatus Paracaedibacter symbiosus]
MAYNRDNNEGQTGRPQVRRQFFRRRKTCPFSGQNAMKIDYKDIRTLSKFISERGKIIPSRISAVSVKKQRELSVAIKRSRFLALMPYVSD